MNQTAEKLHTEEVQRQQLSEEFEQVGSVTSAPLCVCLHRRVTKSKTLLYVFILQAQKIITELQAQLDLLNVSAESPQSDTEDVAQLKVCFQETCRIQLFIIAH